jgi:hypothetical protein
VVLHEKKGSGAGGSKDTGKVICFACHKTDHYASQCPKKKKELEVATTTSTDMDAFAKKIEDEFSLVSSLSINNRLAKLEENGSWFMDSGSSHHMTRMRSVFLSVSETCLDLHVQSGVHAIHAVKGFGCVRFQLESGVSLEVDGVMYVPELKFNFLYVTNLADMEYTMLFVDGKVLLCGEGATLDATMSLEIMQGMMYRLLARPVVGSRGSLNQSSVSGTISWYEMTLMDEQRITSDHSETETNLGGDNSLAKREC